MKKAGIYVLVSSIQERSHIVALGDIFLTRNVDMKPFKMFVNV